MRSSCGGQWSSSTIVLFLMDFFSFCQFHLRFFGRFFRMNIIFGSFSSYVSALAPKFRTKNACVNVDEIDTYSTHLSTKTKKIKNSP